MDFEYIFGTNGNAEVLKIKGPAHTVLTGFQQVVQRFGQQRLGAGDIWVDSGGGMT